MEGKGSTIPNETFTIQESIKVNFNCRSALDITLDKICVLSTNADCFTNKKTDLKLLVDSLFSKPHVMIITEVNPKVFVADLQESEFYIKGYSMFSCNLGTDKKRGIIVYVSQMFTSVSVDILCNFSEYCVVKIENVVTIAAIYKSPSSSANNNAMLYELIDKLNKEHPKNLLLVGDFNFHNIDWKNWNCHSNNNCSQFLNCLRKNLLSQFVDQPTRARGGATPHILDLIISNSIVVSDISYLSPLGKSDHSVLLFYCDVQLDSLINQSNQCKFNLDKGNYEEMRQFLCSSLKQMDEVTYSCVNMMWLTFKQLLEDASNKFIPKYSNYNWKKKKTWNLPISHEYKSSIRKKHNLWSNYLHSRDRTVLSEFKRIRNLVRKESRNNVKKVQSNVSKDCKDNPKRFWKYINLKSKSSPSIGKLKVNHPDGSSRLLENDIDKANSFADFFENIYSNESGNFKELANRMPRDSMECITISTSMIEEKLSNVKINKSPGPDGLHPRIIYEMRYEISGIIKQIFERSIATSTLPDEWKTSIVSVLHKKDRRDSVENYRPISLTCILCKILESILKDHIMSYFIKNNLFSSRQFGFIKGRSVSIQLLHIMNEWTQVLDNGGQIDVMYMDFEKAFDKVPHIRLLSKLNSYGFNTYILNWIKSFLCFRTQRVKVNGILSSPRKVLSGIPQGTILGPVLFIIYINDLPDVCKGLCNMYLFADDAKLYREICSPIDCQTLLECCQDVFNWSNQWCMKLNTNKCKVLSIVRSKSHNKQTYSYSAYTYDNPTNPNAITTLEHVTVFKDLGVLVDSELSFTEHVYSKVNVAYRMLGIINRNFIDLDKHSFILLYKTLVRSHIEFVATVWNPFRISLVHDLEKVQKRATKLVKECRNLNYSDRLKYLKLPTLKYRRVRGDMIEVYKILNGYYDANVQLVLPRNMDARTRGNLFKLKHLGSRLDIRKHSFCVRVVAVWNSLPDNVVTAPSLNSFKNQLDRYWCKQAMLYEWKSDLSCI